MPGFLLGIDPADVGISPPATPIYSYTWTLDGLMQSNISPNSPLIYVKDLTLPEFGVDTEEVAGASLKYKFAKSVTWADVKITFYATGGLIDALDRLKSNVWTPESGIQPAGLYKADTNITQYFADDYTPAQIWTLHGSWIRSIVHSNLTYTNSDVHNVSVTVPYDWATVETP